VRLVSITKCSQQNTQQNQCTAHKLLRRGEGVEEEKGPPNGDDGAEGEDHGKEADGEPSQGQVIEATADYDIDSAGHNQQCPCCCSCWPSQRVPTHGDEEEETGGEKQAKEEKIEKINRVCSKRVERQTTLMYR
jgi:hypothetical protein